MIKNKTILIIDDDDAIRLALQLVLEKENFTVFTASNGQEGLELLGKMPEPCLVILDLMMPVLDGWEFLEIRKKDENLSKIPVIIISAFSDQAKKIKADAFIKKPIDIKQFMETIDKFCNK